MMTSGVPRPGLVGLVVFIAAPAILSGGLATASESEGSSVSDVEVLSVRLAEDVDGQPSRGDVAAVLDVVDRLDGEVRIVDRAADTVSVEVPVSVVDEAATTLAGMTDVIAVTETPQLRRMVRPNDPRWDSQSSYLNLLHLRQAWDETRGSKGIVIAVIDDGLDLRHPDLRTKVVARHNAVTGGRDVRPTHLGHGTLVAGVAAARPNNAKGVAGVGWRTRLMAVKVDDNRGRIYTDAVSSGIRWAARNGADIINISLGGQVGSRQLKLATKRAEKLGVLVIASAGNFGSQRLVYPAAYGKVLAVGATHKDKMARFSSHGDWVDVAAPGQGIVATEWGGGYSKVAGTSFSAPIVAGQASLLKAVKPDATPADLRSAIMESTSDVGATRFANGRIDIAESLAQLQAP